MDKRTESPYSTEDITLVLDIGSSTLRKWCLALEKHGYNFFRTDQNKRLFVDQDIIVLKHFAQLVKDKNMSHNNAALVVTSKFKKSHLFSVETEIEQDKNEVFANETEVEQADFKQLIERIEVMEENQEKLIQLNNELVKRLDGDRQYIKVLIEQRDRELMNSLRETLEQRKIEAERNKGFIKRLIEKLFK